jgi:hypothetical protein
MADVRVNNKPTNNQGNIENIRKFLVCPASINTLNGIRIDAIIATESQGINKSHLLFRFTA